jgi:hypothetical protein
VATQAVGIARAAARALADVVGGRPVVGHAAEVQRRLDLCRGCDRYDAARGRCTVCGCVATWKARLESQHCPIGKW